MKYLLPGLIALALALPVGVAYSATPSSPMVSNVSDTLLVAAKKKTKKAKKGKGKVAKK